jgi:hypothetical protein
MKAFAPRNYDGRENPPGFHHFLKGSLSVSCLEETRVRPKCYACTLPRYLTSRAYAYGFYNQNSDEVFLDALSHYSPASYRIRLQAEMDGLTRTSEQPISEFARELEELCSLIDDVFEGVRVTSGKTRNGNFV